jgi:hypothetical protein
MAVNRGVCIGSLMGKVSLRMWGSSIKCYASGKELVAFGTIDGNRASVDIHEASAAVNARVENCTCIGSMHGRSEFSLKMASFRTVLQGNKVVTFGSPYDENAKTKVTIYNSDVSISQKSEIEKECLGSTDDFLIMDTRYQAVINEKESDKLSLQ